MMSMAGEYGSSKCINFPISENVLLGLENFLKSGYPLDCIRWVRRRIALNPPDGGRNPKRKIILPMVIVISFTLRRYLDAFDAQSKFYGNEQNQQILGYIL